MKLKLNHWLELSQEQRQALVDWPDAADALEQLRQHLRACTRSMADGMVKDLPPVSGAPWQQAELPAAVQEAATVRGVVLTLEQWTQLSELDRFALCKLARPGHDHHNLEAAFSEVLV